MRLNAPIDSAGLKTVITPIGEKPPAGNVHKNHKEPQANKQTYLIFKPKFQYKVLNHPDDKFILRNSIITGFISKCLMILLLHIKHYLYNLHWSIWKQQKKIIFQ